MSLHYEKKFYDVVVAGGGMAGICAALACARQGVSTAIIQARSMYGGNASSEIRMHIVGAGCHMSKENVSETGILMELLLANKDRNYNQSFSVWDGILWEKVRYQEHLDSYLNTCVEEVFTEENAISHIICCQNTTETEYDIYGKIFIDATGHGTMGAMAGALFRTGSEARSEYGEQSAPETANDHTMGNTLMFHAVNVGHPVPFKRPFWAYEFDEEKLKLRHHYNLISAFADGGSFTEFEDGSSNKLPEFTDMDSGYWWIELGGQYNDIIREGEIIRDELLRCVYGVWDHIKNCGDHGAANYVLDWVGMVPGYRESRRLTGDYVLTEQDIRNNRVFEDAVAYGGWPMDDHVCGGIMDFEKYPSTVLNFNGIYTIPYRCYISKNVKNLMMAGRNISTSKMAFGSTRVMGTCAVGGQACGTAAAMAIRYGCLPREVGKHIEELQQQLLKDDCFIPGVVNRDPLDLAKTAVFSASGSKRGCLPEAVASGVSRRIGDTENCWESDPIFCDGCLIPETDKDNLRGKTREMPWISLRLKTTACIRQVRLVFDPNLTREIMPSMTSAVKKRQTEYMPEELVKDYRITLYLAGEIVHEERIRDNIQRLNVLNFIQPVQADQVVVTVESTYGWPTAKIFEIRIYETKE